MLPRDLAVNGFIKQYYPKVDIRDFEKDMFSPEKNNLHTIAFQEKDVKQMIGDNQFYLYLQGGVVFYNKLPYFKNVAGPWKRFFWKFTLFLVPVYFASGYSIYRSSEATSQYYQKYFEGYAKYKCTGNLRDLNPDVKSKFSFFI